MAHKQKGLLTSSKEWAKHLRPYYKRQYWKNERQASKSFIKKEIINESKK